MWTYSPQKRQAGSAFALMYRLLLRSCKLTGVFVISPLPPFLLESLLTAGLLRSTAITPFRSYCGPLRHPLAFRHFPDGTRRATPVAQHVLITVLSLPPRRSVMALRSARAMPCCLRPEEEGSASGSKFCFEATCGFTFVTAR